jgi:hypothetical protein
MPPPNKISSSAIKVNYNGASALWRRIYRYVSFAGLRAGNTEFVSVSPQQYLVLDRLSKNKLHSILNIGSTDGQFINACIDRFPAAKLHSFETDPITCKWLERAFPASKVSIHQLGLSNKPGLRLIEYIANDDQTSALIHGRPVKNGKPEKTIIEEIVGDDFCEAHNLAAIDLMNVNFDAHTDRMLRGFGKNLSAGNIAVIMLNCRLRDEKDYANLRLVSDALTSFLFRMSRVTKNGFNSDRPFDFLDPTTITHSFVAIHQSKKEFTSVLA